MCVESEEGSDLGGFIVNDTESSDGDSEITGSESSPESSSRQAEQVRHCHLENPV